MSHLSRVMPEMALFLFWMVGAAGWAEEKPAGKLIRVSLIEAAKSDTFYVDIKITSLEMQLKEVIESKDDDKERLELRPFKHFTPLRILDKREIVFGRKDLIEIDKEKKMFVELKLEPLVEKYYPAMVRWFTREGETDKEIIEAKDYKFYQDRSLLLIKLNTNSSTALLLAIEFVEPDAPEESGKPK
ncbi:MAG: hypothetical protein ACE15F_05280 [bacterium]